MVLSCAYRAEMFAKEQLQADLHFVIDLSFIVPIYLQCAIASKIYP
jgi:hypothetical protein